MRIYVCVHACVCVCVTVLLASAVVLPSDASLLVPLEYHAPLLPFQLSAEMRCSSGQPLPFTATVESVFRDEGIIRQFSCHGKVTQQQIHDFAHPVERDLVVLGLSGGGGANQIEGAESASWRVFGIVTSMKQIRCKGPKGARSEAEGIGSSVANSDAALSLIIKVITYKCVCERG